MNDRIKKLELLIEKATIGEVDPTPEEIELIAEYEKEKREGKIIFKSFK